MTQSENVQQSLCCACSRHSWRALNVKTLLMAAISLQEPLPLQGLGGRGDSVTACLHSSPTYSIRERDVWSCPPHSFLWRALTSPVSNSLRLRWPSFPALEFSLIFFLSITHSHSVWALIQKKIHQCTFTAQIVLSQCVFGKQYFKINRIRLSNTDTAISAKVDTT